MNNLKIKQPIIAITSVVVIFILGYFLIRDIKLNSDISSFPNNNIRKRIDRADSLRTSFPDSSIVLFNEIIGNIEGQQNNPELCHLLALAYSGIAATQSEMGQYPLALKNDSLSISLASINDDKQVLARAHLTMGLTFLRLGDCKLACDNLTEAMNYALAAGDSVLVGKIHAANGQVFANQGDYEKAKECFYTALLIGKRNHNDMLIGGNYLNIGIVFDDYSENDSALCYFNNALNIFRKNNDRNGELICYQQIGSVLYNKPDYSKALENFKLAKDLAVEMNDKPNLAKALHNMAEVYSHIGDTETATDLYFQSIKIKQGINNKISLARGYMGLGALYYNRDEYTKSMEYFKQALVLVEEFGAQFVMASNYSNIGSIYSNLNKRDSAIFYYNKAMEIYKENEYPHGLSNLLMNLGSEYCLTKNFSLAEEYLKSSLNIKKEIEEEEGVANANYYLANFALMKAETVSGADERTSLLLQAEKWGLESYSTAKRINALPVMKQACEVLKKIYTSQKRFEEALNYSELFNTLNDSLLNKDKIDALTFAEARWNTEKKEFEIDKLEAAKELQQKIIAQKTVEARQSKIMTLIIISLFLLFVTLGILATLYFRKRRETERQKQLANITMLRMQNIRNAISPHFMFNVLNAIWAIIDDREHAREKFDNLMNLIRRSLINTEKIAIPLDEEIEFVKNFIELQQLRMNDDFEVNWKIDEKIDKNFSVPGMILQIPVENALKHGLSQKNGEKTLNIDISSSAGYLEMVVSDNGLGYQAVPGKMKGTGTGLKVLTNTVHILNQINNQKMSYEMINLVNEGEKGTKVVIKIPFNFNYNLN